MKTLTEFSVLALKNAAKTKAELLTSGKTAEELPAALGEALKLEGDKLTHLINLLELIGPQINDLKRGLCLLPAESEKVPEAIKKVGDHFYQIEYYPPIPKKLANGQFDRQERSDKGGRDKRGGKKGGGRGDKKDFKPRSPGQDSGRPSGPGVSDGPGNDRKPRFAAKAPRPPMIISGVSTGPKPVITPRITPLVPPPVTTPAETAQAPTPSSGETPS